MLVKSIRWRMQLWQAFLLVCILTGFGATAYKLHRSQRFGQIDEDLGRRVATLSEDVRSSFPLRPPPGPPPLEPEPGFDPEPVPAQPLVSSVSVVRSAPELASQA